MIIHVSRLTLPYKFKSVIVYIIFELNRDW